MWQSFLSMLAVWAVHFAKFVSPKGWKTVTLAELIKEAEEAQVAQVAVGVAATNVETKKGDRVIVIAQAEAAMDAADEAVVSAEADHTAALEKAVAELAEANASLLAFVNSLPGNTPVPEPVG